MMVSAMSAAQFFWGPYLVAFIILLPVAFVADVIIKELSARFSEYPLTLFVMFCIFGYSVIILTVEFILNV